MFTRFNRIHKRDGRTDGQTDGRRPHDGTGRAMHSIAWEKPQTSGPMQQYSDWYTGR